MYCLGEAEIKMCHPAGGVKSNHPLKPLGRRCAPPTQKPPVRATVWIFSLIWLQSTKNLEPFSSVMLVEPCRLSPNACASKPALAPPEKPFALFF